MSVEEPWQSPDALRLDGMTFSSYVEQHVWTKGKERVISIEMYFIIPPTPPHMFV